MASDKDILSLLERYNKAYPNRRLNEQELADMTEEWLKVLGGYNAKLLDEALTEYIANDTRVYSRLPKAGELRQICDNLLEEIQRKTSLDYAGKCPFCLGGGFALVDFDGENPFYGNYGGLGVKCPCRHPGEIQALQRGLKIKRRLKPGYLEMWLEGSRILGRLQEQGRKEPASRKEPVRQQSLKQAFNGLTSEDLPF